MRFSPYAMEDYGLQHGGGTVLPVTVASYEEAAWNICWASVPEYDKFLDLPYEDFDGFRKLVETFPFERRRQALQLLQEQPALAATFATGTPMQVVAALIGCTRPTLSVFREKSSAWVQGVMGRLQLAQSLVDVRDAAAVCQNVTRVDFRARRRL